MANFEDRTLEVCEPLIEAFDPPIIGGSGGSLSGIRIAVKDNFDIKGFVTGGGSPEWSRTHARATSNAAAVEKILDAGGAIVGKAHMDELAYSLMGMNAHYGTPRNPVAPDRAPGGSSSGSAVAVAAGLADVAIGSDTGGSVRIPASFCGLFGLRPTHGLIDCRGLLPLAPSFDTVGLFARDAVSLRTLAQTFGIAGEPEPRRFLRPLDVWSFATPATRKILEDSLGRMTGRAHIEDLHLSKTGIDEWRKIFQIIQAYEIWQTFGAWIEANRPSFGPGTRERFEMARQITASEFTAAGEHRLAIRQIVLDVIGHDGVLIVPTAPGPAPLLVSSGAEIDQYRAAALSMLCIAGLCGLPQITIPFCHVDNAPAGLSLIGPPGSDGTLLALAGSLPSGA